MSFAALHYTIYFTSTLFTIYEVINYLQLKFRSSNSSWAFFSNLTPEKYMSTILTLCVNDVLLHNNAETDVFLIQLDTFLQDKTSKISALSMTTYVVVTTALPQRT